MNYQNKSVLLTGATGGIGQSIARVMAEKGARLILVSRNPDSLESMRSELPAGNHVVVAADLATEEGRRTVLEACGDSLDILINNAGVSCFGMLEAHSEDQLRDLFDVNVLAPILLTQAVLAKLEAARGVVVNIGSGFGSIGFAGFCGYSASKFALRGFTEALRRELGDRDVRVAYLAPRATETDMNVDAVVAMNKELGNTMDDPDTVAEALLDLLNGSSSARYIGWPERFFVKLNSLFPSIVDSALVKQLAVIRRHAQGVNLAPGETP